MSAEHDNYLTTLGHCEAAIVGIRGLDFDDEASINRVEPDFECEMDETTGLVRVTFEIYFIIRTQ